MGILCFGGLFAFAWFTPTTFLSRSPELTVHGNESGQSMASDIDRAIKQMWTNAEKRGQRFKANISILTSSTSANEQDTSSGGKRESLVSLHNDELERLSMEYSISWGKPAFVGLDADSSKDLSNLSKEDVSAALTEAELEEDDYYYTRDPVYIHLTDGVWEEESEGPRDYCYFLRYYDYYYVYDYINHDLAEAELEENASYAHIYYYISVSYWFHKYLPIDDDAAGEEYYYHVEELKGLLDRIDDDGISHQEEIVPMV